MLAVAVREHLDLESRIGGYEAADARQDLLDAAYGHVGALIGARAGNIAFTESATASTAQALSSIPFERGDDGYPVQYRGVVDSAPGLYFVGMLFLHSFASMLIAGTCRDAERLARHIASQPARRRASAGPPPVPAHAAS